ncbi:MAG: hypothetical protein H6668_09925 [Ardenticatenaceae bacterium]|nr:hypothetical protein [Ardenticatenaceae bacterium]
MRSAQRTCEALGIRSVGHHLPATATQEEVEGLVASLNADPNVNGILVQLPLPKHIDEEAVLNSVSLEKDVDGSTPDKYRPFGDEGREPLFIPCTPRMAALCCWKNGAKISGAEAVVVGRSNIVGCRWRCCCKSGTPR